LAEEEGDALKSVARLSQCRRRLGRTSRHLGRAELRIRLLDLGEDLLRLGVGAAGRTAGQATGTTSAKEGHLFTASYFVLNRTNQDEEVKTDKYGCTPVNHASAPMFRRIA
jgi:hypothetical protein